MKNQNKELLLNYSMLLGIVLILLVGMFSIYYYFRLTNESCTSSPFVYGARELEKMSGVEVSGVINFVNHPELRIIFNSNEATTRNYNFIQIP